MGVEALALSMTAYILDHAAGLVTVAGPPAP